MAHIRALLAGIMGKVWNWVKPQLPRLYVTRKQYYQVPGCCELNEIRSATTREELSTETPLSFPATSRGP